MPIAAACEEKGKVEDELFVAPHGHETIAQGHRIGVMTLVREVTGKIPEPAPHSAVEWVLDVRMDPLQVALTLLYDRKRSFAFLRERWRLFAGPGAGVINLLFAPFRVAPPDMPLDTV